MEQWSVGGMRKNKLPIEKALTVAMQLKCLHYSNLI